MTGSSPNDGIGLSGFAAVLVIWILLLKLDERPSPYWYSGSTEALWRTRRTSELTVIQSIFFIPSGVDGFPSLGWMSGPARYL